MIDCGGYSHIEGQQGVTDERPRGLSIADGRIHCQVCMMHWVAQWVGLEAYPSMQCPLRMYLVLDDEIQLLRSQCCGFTIHCTICIE